MKDVWIRATLEKYEGPLTRYAYRVTRDLEQAREVVQDVFLRLWQEDPEKIQTHVAEWLFTVCRNRAIDLRRKDKRMVPLSPHDAESTVSESSPPDAEIEKSQNLSQTMKAMAKLPERQQEVLRLKFQNGMTYDQIARVTGLSASNVGFLIHTAMKAMKAALLVPAVTSSKGVSHE